MTVLGPQPGGKLIHADIQTSRRQKAPTVGAGAFLNKLLNTNLIAQDTTCYVIGSKSKMRLR